MTGSPSRGHLLRGLIAYCAEHSPRTYDDGSTCDEHGCAVCNIGAQRCAQEWLDAAHAGDPTTAPLPSRGELARALLEQR
jgi:hypothetical protein